MQDEATFAEWMEMILEAQAMTPHRMLWWCPESLLKKCGVERPATQFDWRKERA